MLRASGIFGDSRIDFLIRNITDSCYFSPALNGFFKNDVVDHSLC